MDEKPSILWRILSPWTILAMLISVDLAGASRHNLVLVAVGWLTWFSLGIRPLSQSFWKGLVVGLLLRLLFAATAYWLVVALWVERDPLYQQYSYSTGLFFLACGLMLWLIPRYWRFLP